MQKLQDKNLYSSEFFVSKYLLIRHPDAESKDGPFYWNFISILCDDTCSGWLSDKKAQKFILNKKLKYLCNEGAKT